MKKPKKKPVTLAKLAPPKRAAPKAKKAPAKRKLKQLELEEAITASKPRTKKAKVKSMAKKPTEKPADEPEEVDEGSGQSPESAEPPAAEAPAEGLSDETGEHTHDFDESDPDELAARDRAVRAQVEDFVENLPPGAESGLYSGTAHDRWTNGPYQLDIPDGTYAVANAGGWALTFRAGRLTGAKHESRMTEVEAHGVTLIGS